MVVQRPGVLVARGNTSDVYAWGPQSIVKLLRPQIPPRWAEREAGTTELVRAAGLPAIAGWLAQKRMIRGLAMGAIK